VKTAYGRALLCAAIATGILISSPRLAAQGTPQPGPAARLAASVVSAGAAASAEASHILVGTVGQPLIGTAAGPSGRGAFGFWTALPSIVSAVGPERDAVAPADYAVRGYPNPFSSSTLVSWTLPLQADARIDIVDALGRHIRTFELGALGVGRHFLRWDGRTADGRPVASGRYTAVLSASARSDYGAAVQTRSALLPLDVLR
jgi:hypothetical protein